MKTGYDYKDSTVWIKKVKWNNVEDYQKIKWKCPMCYDYIKNGDVVYLVFNNYKYFPNVILHEDCFVEVKADYIFSEIEREYNEVKYKKNIFNLE